MKKMIISLLLIILSLSCFHYGALPVIGWPSLFFGGFIGVLLFIGIVVLLIYLLIDRDKLIKKIEKETPLDILKKRYVRGEIAKSEYEKMKKELE